MPPETQMKIVKYPHPALRCHARPLTAIDKKIRLQAGAMLDLMYESHGLGLASTQVALPFQLLVMNPLPEPQQHAHERVLINPVISDKRGSIEGEEGCLSFPGLYQKVRRAKTVTVRAYNLNGETVEAVVSDLESRVVQHEVDHLHGVLFIDKMGAIAKLASRSTLKEFEQEFRKLQERGAIPPDSDLEKMLTALEAQA